MMILKIDSQQRAVAGIFETQTFISSIQTKMFVLSFDLIDSNSLNLVVSNSNLDTK